MAITAEILVWQQNAGTASSSSIAEMPNIPPQEAHLLLGISAIKQIQNN
jgi:hypothetical protein